MTHKALENYFFRIVNTSPKELTMLEVLKAKWTEFWNTRFEFSTEEPVTEEQPKDYWSFYVRTEGYKETGNKESFIQGGQDGTWMGIVDQLLDVIGHHYGYNIKEHVYYSVQFPANLEGEAGYGRMLNDDVLQKLLLTYPEAYEPKGRIEQ